LVQAGDVKLVVMKKYIVLAILLSAFLITPALAQTPVSVNQMDNSQLIQLLLRLLNILQAQPTSSTPVAVNIGLCSNGALFNSQTGARCSNSTTQPLPVVDATAPYISSISPWSVPLGGNLQIKGSGWNGFEGHVYFSFKRLTDGRIARLPAVILSNTTGPGENIVNLVVKEPCQPGQTMYGEGSGLPIGQCDYVQLTPGTYGVSISNGNKVSNSLFIKITPAGSQTTYPQFLSPQLGENWQIGEWHVIKFDQPVVSNWPQESQIIIKLFNAQTGSVVGILDCIKGNSWQGYAWNTDVVRNSCGASTNPYVAVGMGSYRFIVSYDEPNGLILAQSPIFTVSGTAVDVNSYIAKPNETNSKPVCGGVGLPACG
jgi:hypothetical protein